MRLGELLDAIDPTIEFDLSNVTAVDRKRTVGAVRHDSRAVEAGDIFCCIRGLLADGHRFAPVAVAAGASALAVDEAADRDALLALGVPLLVAHDSRHAMAHLAAARVGYPSRRLRMVGITGTNGKTTTAALLAGVLETAGVRVDVIGTLTGERTTPESTDLALRLAAIAEDGGDVVVMEVSSHALDQHRVDGVVFELGLFTNLTQDHLDYHATMENYFRAKAKLFQPVQSKAGIVIADGAYGSLLSDSAVIPTTTLRVGRDIEMHDAGADRLDFSWRGHRVQLPLGGHFNAANALLAAESAVALGIDAETVVRGLEAAPLVRGRFESVPNDLGFSVIVDYAHTPDGIRNVLESARLVASGGRVIVVFGCGGDRDRKKRPRMGSLAQELADVIILTSDNPRSESPDAIIADILAGMRTKPLVEPDRRAAISAALASAERGDVVVLAGKGHETTQTIGDVVLPFDDAAVAAELVVEIAEARR